MSCKELTKVERKTLLRVARSSIELRVNGQSLEPLKLSNFTKTLREDGASFVTLTKFGQLRGCIGTLEPYQPLVLDVREHALASALEDYRFPPVKSNELNDVNIEISRLTPPVLLEYQSVDDLLMSIRPGIDGVVLLDGLRKATFLPQVWEKLPDPNMFFSNLCLKMGLPSDTWRVKKLTTMVYQVEEFSE